MSDSHLSSHELAGYLSAELSASEHRRIEAHLADCDGCRDELVAVRQLTEAAPVPKRRFPIGVGLAAAAVIAVLLLPWRTLRQPASGDTVDVQRPVAEAGRESVEVVSPTARTPVDVGAISPIWHADSVGSIYQVRVTDEDGDVLWTGTTRDTTLTVPSTAFKAGAGGTHYLYVDAQRPNGYSVSSGARRFEVRP